MYAFDNYEDGEEEVKSNKNKVPKQKDKKDEPKDPKKALNDKLFELRLKMVIVSCTRFTNYRYLESSKKRNQSTRI